ncbi:MAG: cell division topological specificity factor MinE [Candidatus Poribacteria bacterium]|nr:cell division topological specificity factor MinE [Candidatus Poribacteria bacterium]
MLKQLVRLLRRNQKSKDVAKSRLQLILVQDRIGIDEQLMQALQTDMTALLSRYFELEQDGIEMEMQREGQSMALVANIPVSSLKIRRPLQA